jgi:transcriptional regulator with XRE-family HTH domain
MPEPNVATVKQNLRLARTRLNISQREAASRAGVSKSVLEKYESTENARIPNTRQLFKLAEAYRLSIDYLLGRSEVIEVQRRRQPAVELAERKRAYSALSIASV